MMTIDELSFAGGLSFTSLNSPYVWFYTNSQGNSITGNTYWWSLSPNSWSGSGPYAFVWSVGGSGDPGGLDGDYVRTGNGVRPSLSLNPCVKAFGNGTPESPYEIDYDNSCK